MWIKSVGQNIELDFFALKFESSSYIDYINLEYTIALGSFFTVEQQTKDQFAIYSSFTHIDKGPPFNQCVHTDNTWKASQL